MFGRGNGTRVDSAAEASGTSGTPGRGAQTVTRVRMVLAQVIWLLFLVAALFLAVGALLVALDANQDNDLVKFVLEGADRVDLGIFSRDNGIKQFTGSQRGDQERPVQLGSRRRRVAGRGPDPGPADPPLTAVVLPPNADEFLGVRKPSPGRRVTRSDTTVTSEPP